MVKEIVILTDDQYIVFLDKLNENRVLAFHKSQLQKKKEITFQYGREENVPDNFKIDIVELNQVVEYGENRFGYDITNFETQEFPINQIKWGFIKSGSY